MANLRDIRKRISSVQSTEQITRTMEMVSTAKIRRALDRAMQAEPYKAALTDVMLTVAQDAEVAGNNPMLNVGAARAAEKIMGGWEREGAKAEVIACGRKATEYFHHHDNLVMHFEGNSAEPNLEDARMISSYVCRAYAAGELDRVDLVYHHARNRVDQDLRVEHLLPLDPEAVAMAHGPRKNDTEGPSRVSSSFKFVPSAEHVLGELVPSYILTVIHQALIDSAAAEQGARRKAMHSATENATAIVATLTRTYNRVRQASITTEINEIVGGASALEEQ